MLFDSVAFKNIISTGLVLDKNGNKMSKSKPETLVDPFVTIDQYGSDPLRWYMITNAQPWDNLKFDLAGMDEVKRKFFGTLYNTYSFFSLYANLDKFTYAEKEIPVNERPEIDRWIISLLNTLVKNVSESLDNYEPTQAGRLIQDFVIDNLSNWYVRLNRKRFWGQDYNNDKIAAYQTLYTCLETISIIMSPIAPFYADKLYCDLTTSTGRNKFESVHLAYFPKCDETHIDKIMEERMEMAQELSSMVLGLRRNVKIKVRQPLTKIMIPILDETFEAKIDAVKNIILTEINVKEIEYLKDTSGIFDKQIKPNFKLLGRKYGKQMKDISDALSQLSQQGIMQFEKEKTLKIGTDIEISIEEVELSSNDIPGLPAASNGRLSVALDVNITPELKNEGIARELVNKIQNLRKDSGLQVSDKIQLEVQKHNEINQAVENYKEYICSQTLAESIELKDNVNQNDNGTKIVEFDELVSTYIRITKI